MNEFKPEILSQRGLVAVFDDDTPPGTVVLSPLQGSDALVSFQVEDRDHGLDGVVTYTLFSIDDFARDYFYLNQSSGEIILTKQFNKTQCQQEGRHIDLLDTHISIVACDRSDISSCPTLSLQIYIIPSECAPSFSQNRTQVYVNERAPIGTSLASIPCTVNSADNRTVTIVSKDPEIIETFALSSRDGSLTLLKSLDYEQRENYSFYLLCVNSYRSEAIAEVEVVVAPDNDNPPLFNSPLFIINITSPILFIPYRIGEILAQDNDRGLGGNVTYALTEFNKYFAMENNGTILLTDIPPNDENTVFVLEVRASDGRFSAETKVLVLLSNNHASQAQQNSAAEDDSSTTSAILTGAVVFLGVLLLLSCDICRAPAGSS